MSLVKRYKRAASYLIVFVLLLVLTAAQGIAQEPVAAAPQLNSSLIQFMRIFVMVVAFLIAIVPHEVAHGLAAEKLGDPTARALGRITLNPIRHVDLMMTIVFPAVLIISGSPIIFGGAKPVPVDPRYFKNPRRGMAYVAFAGPLSNFLIATLCIMCIPIAGILLRVLQFPPLLAAFSMDFLYITALINVFLGAFNLIPIPPLDGGRIAVGFLPTAIARRWAALEPYGLLLVVLLLLAGLVDFLIKPVLFFLEGLSKIFL